jgi:hypothetical protein
MYGRETQSRSVIEKNKTYNSRWIIPCIPLCTAVVRDRLVGGLTVPSS